MNELFSMIQSENMKLYSRKGPWIMAFILILFVLMTSTIWRITSPRSIWNLVVRQISALFLINIFMIIVGGGIVANEYTWGTIKMLLIRPVSRSRIFLAKYLALILFGLAMMVILFLAALLVNASLLLFQNPGIGGAATSGRNLWFESLGGAALYYALRFVEVAIYGTFALMLSTLSKSHTLSVGASLLTLLFGPEITRMLSDTPWARFILFANLDLTGYIRGNSPLAGMGFGFSLAVLFAYGLAFFLISRAVFIHRDVLE